MKACKDCGELFKTVGGSDLRCAKCKRPWTGPTRKGAAHPQYKGGHLNGRGYKNVPHDTKPKILEHRAVMEKHIGRPLEKHEVVHHKDHDKLNNAIENLELMTRGEHTRMHQLEIGWGKRGATHCSTCGKNDSPHKSRGVCIRCYEVARWERRKPTYKQEAHYVARKQDH